MQVSFNFEQEFNTILKSRLNQKMGQFTLKLFLKNFKNESYLDGNGSLLKWKPLSASYDKYKKSKKDNYPIGVFDGDLKQGFVINYQSNGFTITNKAPHAEWFANERPILYQDSSIDKEMIKFIDEEMNKLFQNHTKKYGNK